MNLLAKSCFAPGLIAMISNLIASAGSMDTDGEKEWFIEYTEGMGHEIYRRQIFLDDGKKGYPDQVKFSKIVEISYIEQSAIVFAVEI